MNKNTSQILAGFLVLSALFLFLTPVTGKSTEKTKLPLGSIIRSMQQRFDTVQTLKADFDQETFSGAVRLRTHGEGKIYLKKPKMMRWDYMKPEKQSFVTDGTKAWLYIPSEKRILLDDAKKFFDSALVRSFFNGPKDFSKYFTVKLKEQNKYPGYVLFLVPKKSNLDVREITLWVRAKDFQVEKIETKDFLGNTNKVMLHNISFHSDLPEDLFVLKIPAGFVVEESDRGATTNQLVPIHK